MSYHATLTMEEVKKFCADFYELESARTTKVEITPDDKHINFRVVLMTEDICADLLDASFHDGLLSHWGWHKKFVKN